MSIAKGQKEAAEFYRSLLRQMRREGVSLDEIPPNLEDAFRELHANAIFVYYAEHHPAWLERLELRARQDPFKA